MICQSRCWQERFNLPSCLLRNSINFYPVFFQKKGGLQAVLLLYNNTQC